MEPVVITFIQVYMITDIFYQENEEGSYVKLYDVKQSILCDTEL